MSSPITPQRARRTARGTVITVASSLWAGIAGFALVVYLARALGPENFGIWALVLSIITWSEHASFSLWTRSVPKFVSAAGEKWREVANSALVGGLFWFTAWCGLLLILAPLIAESLGESLLTAYLRLFALDLPVFGAGVLLLSVLAGREKYNISAGGSVLYWAAKLVFMCGLVAAGLGIRGAIIGSIAASVIGLCWAWRYSGVRIAKPTFPLRQLIAFSIPVMLAAVLFKLLQTVDLWMVKGLLNDNVLAGQYGVAIGVIQTGIMLAVALNVTVLPAVSREISENREESVQNTVRQAYRFLFVVMGLLVAIMAAASTPIITLVFSEQYAEAGIPAAILTGGALALSILGIGQTILIAASRPTWALWAMLPLVPLDIALNVLLIPRYQLVGAALATTITALIGACVLAVLVWIELKVVLQPLMLARVAAAAAITYGIGTALSFEGPLVLLQCATVSLAYVAILFGLGELKRKDLEPFIFWQPAKKSPTNV